MENPMQTSKSSAITIKCIDHFVITTPNPQAISCFYQKLGFTATKKPDEIVLALGDFKIHVQIVGKELYPHAQHVQPGSVDICFHVAETIQEVEQQLKTADLAVEVGPVPRVGAHGNMTSVYLRDPDGNLVELGSYGGR